MKKALKGNELNLEEKGEGIRKPRLVMVKKALKERS